MVICIMLRLKWVMGWIREYQTQCGGPNATDDICRCVLCICVWEKKKKDE